MSSEHCDVWVRHPDLGSHRAILGAASEDEDGTGRTPEGRSGDCLQRQHQVSFNQSPASSSSGHLTRADLSPCCLILAGRLVTTGNQRLPDCSKLSEVAVLCRAAAPHAGPPLPQTRSACSPPASGPDPGSPPAALLQVQPPSAPRPLPIFLQSV